MIEIREGEGEEREILMISCDSLVSLSYRLMMISSAIGDQYQTI